MEQLNGILVVDKPKGLSSAQCVGRIKRLGQKKIGHAGTLDPMATGVLLVLLGQGTKISNYLLEGGAKTYLGTLRLGVVTDTWDIEGRVVQENPVQVTTEFGEPTASPDEVEKAVRREVEGWLETREQPVPPYSAAKHQGQPLYKLARSGKAVPDKVKSIQISHAEVQWVNLPDARFRVTCSSGSYIRSLAHSLGMRLGCGATLTELTRQYSHPFSLEDAVPLDALLDDPGLLPQRVLPLAAALPHWSSLTVGPLDEADLRNGIPLAHRPELGEARAGDQAVICGMDGGYLALAEAHLVKGALFWVILRGLFTP